MARDGHRATQIPLVMLPLASDIKANELSPSQLRIEMIVKRERKEWPWEYGILARHRPRPEIGPVGSRTPARAFHDRLHHPLVHARTNRAHTRQQGSHRGSRRRTQRSYFTGILHEH